MTKQEFFDNWNPAFGVEASGEPQEANRQFWKDINALLKDAQMEAWVGARDDDCEIGEIYREYKNFKDWYKRQEK